MKLILKGILFFIGSTVIYSQTSLYSGVNPYKKNLKTGDTVKVNVNSRFIVNVSGDYSKNFEVKLKLIPDSKNLSFLKQSEESRANIRKSKEKQLVVEKFSFSLPASVTAQNDGTLTLNGNSSISSNGKVTRIAVTGLINESSVKNGEIESAEIINLNLQIVSEPVLPKDQSLVFDEAKAESETQGLSPVEVKKYINQYLQEVLGGLK